MTVTRITNLMLSQQMLANITQGQQALAATQEQMSTGKRINQASDDPYGAGLAVTLKGQLAQLAGYSSNVSDGTAWTTAGLSAMSSISQQLQRAQELVVAANNGTNSKADLQATAGEIDQLIEGIKSDADTQYNGQYVFSGTTTAPYDTTSNPPVDTPQGTYQDVTRVIGPSNANVTVNVSLSGVLDGSSGLIQTLRSISSDLKAGDTSNLSGDLKTMSDNLNSLGQAQASLGSAAGRLTLASTRLDTLQTNTTAALSDDQDANVAATYTTFSNEQAAFTAALKAGASIVQTSLMDFLSN